MNDLLVTYDSALTRALTGKPYIAGISTRPNSIEIENHQGTTTHSPLNQEVVLLYFRSACGEGLLNYFPIHKPF